MNETKQEPVAWMYQNANTDSEYLVWKRSPGGRNWKPLYTHPATSVNTALLEALRTLADYVDERAGDNECRPLENARAAIAQAETKEPGEVRK